MVMFAVLFESGCHVVALLPSMAASAYCPGTMVGAVASVKEVSLVPEIVLHCAMSVMVHELKKE